MGSLSKQKGASFERQVCVQLSQWVSASKRDDLFWRSSMSGGRATIGRKVEKSRSQQAGDISAIDPNGHILTDMWYIECKHVADLNIAAAIYNGIGTLAKFWQVAEQEAGAHEKLPMLIARQNRQPTIMLVPAPHILTMNELGTVNPLLARVPALNCDILLYEGVLKRPFKKLYARWAGH